MIVFTSNDKRVIDVGSDIIWRSVLYTMRKFVKDYKTHYCLAYRFLCTGSCTSGNAQETAKQINLLRDAFSSVKPELAVFGENDDSTEAPWGNNLSPIVTSCANMYLTSDGKDLLFEIVNILTYASIIGVNVFSDGLSIYEEK